MIHLQGRPLWPSGRSKDRISDFCLRTAPNPAYPPLKRDHGGNKIDASVLLPVTAIRVTGEHGKTAVCVDRRHGGSVIAEKSK